MSALRRLRAWHRVTWHRLTGRWPRYKWGLGWDGGPPCTPRENLAFGRLAARWKRKTSLAAEPDYQRKEQR